MTDFEAKELVSNVFAQIKCARTIKDLESIPHCNPNLMKNRMDAGTYPKIEFDVKAEEVNELIEQGLVTNKYSLSIDAIQSLSPLAKILYSVVWKNGDIKKIRHIIEGVLNSTDDSHEKDEALVFYQFGKYLTKEKGQPIIDQHVLRAFAVYQSKGDSSVNRLRSINTINKSHKGLIEGYKSWLASSELTEDLKMAKEYSYYIDKILFALDKTIKNKKKVKGIKDESVQ